MFSLGVEFFCGIKHFNFQNFAGGYIKSYECYIVVSPETS